MFAEDNRYESRDKPVIRFWLPLLILAFPFLAVPGGCTSGSSVPGAQSSGPGVTSTDSPSMAEMEQMLAEELKRLGKSTMAVGDYAAPSGDMNIPFDLHAQVIDPDGEGGADPLGVHVSWTERLIGDYNMDGLVNASDLTPIGQYYSQTVDYRDPADVGGVEWWPEETAYHILNDAAPRPWRLARIDGNGDGLIDLADITPIGQHWQERITSYGFEISRGGGQLEVVSDPASPGTPYAIEHGTTLLKEIHGAYWLDTPLMYEINLPIEIEPGDEVRVVPMCSTVRDLSYGTECIMDRPVWSWEDPMLYCGGTLLGEHVIRLYDGDTVQGIFVSAPEYFGGDLDGNGICHAIETSLLEPYFNRTVDSFAEPERIYADRLDWNRDGFISTSDLNPIGSNVKQRMDGIAFCLRDEHPDNIPILSTEYPGQRLVVARPFTVDPPIDHVYRCLLPDQPGEDEIGICIVSSGVEGKSICEPRYRDIWHGASSSLPGEGEPLVAVIGVLSQDWRGNWHISGNASYSLDSTIVNFEWDTDGDGVFDVIGESYTNVVQTSGEHIITLRVTDDQGNSAEATMTVTVSE